MTIGRGASRWNSSEHLDVLVAVRPDGLAPVARKRTPTGRWSPCFRGPTTSSLSSTTRSSLQKTIPVPWMIGTARLPTTSLLPILRHLVLPSAPNSQLRLPAHTTHIQTSSTPSGRTQRVREARELALGMLPGRRLSLRSLSLLRQRKKLISPRQTHQRRLRAESPHRTFHLLRHSPGTWINSFSTCVPQRWPAPSARPQARVSAISVEATARKSVSVASANAQGLPPSWARMVPPLLKMV